MHYSKHEDYFLGVVKNLSPMVCVPRARERSILTILKFHAGANREKNVHVRLSVRQ